MGKHIHYRLGKSSRHKKLRLVLLLVGIAAVAIGSYILYLAIAPQQKPLNTVEQKKFTDEIPYRDNLLIIPKIAVDTQISAGDSFVLTQGVWHRYPERGDPDKGGNFILSGHRFVMSKTPTRTKEQSFLYNINKLVKGDQILVNWTGRQRIYSVSRVYSVKPNDIDIEAASKEAMLTLYSCTLGGTYDGRVVVEALLQP